MSSGDEDIRGKDQLILAVPKLLANYCEDFPLLAACCRGSQDLHATDRNGPSMSLACCARHAGLHLLNPRLPCLAGFSSSETPGFLDLGPLLKILGLQDVPPPDRHLQGVLDHHLPR